MAFVIWFRRSMSSQRIRFVEARTARVISAGERNGYGYAVDIRHSNGIVTRYGHASKLLVHAGDYVMPGQEIALVDSTGRSTGPHLHFVEVIVDGAQLNPKPYLNLFSQLPHHAHAQG